MSRNTEYKFVDTDSDAIVAHLIASYEKETKKALKPADPERLFISWMASAMIQERISQNHVGNQNLPSRAEGENLDALGEWIYNITRPAATPSKCKVRFYLSKTQETSIAIPRGTRVTTVSGTPIWYTTEDAVVEIGDLFADVVVQCETAGDSGNGYVAGQINTLIDVDNILYFSSCENMDTASGGSNEAGDEQYYELMREGMDAYSIAGPRSAYIYWAKSVSSNIADVRPVQPQWTVTKTIPLYTDANGNKHGFLGGTHLLPDTLVIASASGEENAVNSVAVNGSDYTYTYKEQLLDILVLPSGSLADMTSITVTFQEIKAGYVYLYALMNDGTLADSTVKAAILEACNKDTVRPLTDYVFCDDAETIGYNVDITYWIDRNFARSIKDIQASVSSAVNQYIEWQAGKIGRDINPSYLEWMLKDSGIKRVKITEPVFVKLRNGDDHAVPQVAQIGTVNIVNGGFEDE